MSYERVELPYETPAKKRQVFGGCAHKIGLKGYLKTRELLEKVEYDESLENVSIVASVFGVSKYEALNIIRRRHILDLKRARQNSKAAADSSSNLHGL